MNANICVSANPSYLNWYKQIVFFLLTSLPPTLAFYFSGLPHSSARFLSPLLLFLFYGWNIPQMIENLNNEAQSWIAKICFLFILSLVFLLMRENIQWAACFSKYLAIFTLCRFLSLSNNLSKPVFFPFFFTYPTVSRYRKWKSINYDRTGWCKEERVKFSLKIVVSKEGEQGRKVELVETKIKERAKDTDDGALWNSDLCTFPVRETGKRVSLNELHFWLNKSTGCECCSYISF